MKDCSIEYGMIAETDEIEIWYEPINDEIDGFVIHNKDEEHSIVKIYISSDDYRPTKYFIR